MILNFNKQGDKIMATYKCKLCMKVFDVVDGETPICPLCGALHTLGTKTCTFCENDLPYDPLIK